MVKNDQQSIQIFQFLVDRLFFIYFYITHIKHVMNPYKFR